MTLLGEVEKTDKEEVYINLRIDNGKKGTYPYPFRPETGNMLYNMPQKGTTVSLYIPNHDERFAMIINSIRQNTSQDMTDPSKRTFTTEHGKKLDLYKDQMKLKSKTTGTKVGLADEDTIFIKSHKNINIIAKEEILLKAKVINIDAKEELNLIKGDALSGTVESSITQGTEIDKKAKTQTKATGTQLEEFSPIPDAPPEEKFDGAKVFGNVVAGLAVVGLVTLTLATFGAARPVVIGAAIGGGLAVGMTAVGDIARGKVSSKEEYIFAGFTGAITGAISGHTNALKIGKGAKIAREVVAGFLTGGGESIASQMYLENKTFGQIDSYQVARNALLNAAVALITPEILETKPVKRYTDQLTKNIKKYKEMQNVFGIVPPSFRDFGGEALEEGVEKAGKTIVKDSSDDIVRKIQKEAVENTPSFSELSAHQKGNFGEMKTDVIMENELKTTRIGDRITDINQGGHHGIDGVYKVKPEHQPPKFYNVDAKCIQQKKPTVSKIKATDKNGKRIKQMSEGWFGSKVDTYGDRFLQYANGDEKLAKEMRKAYGNGETMQLISHVKPDGSVDLYEIDKTGKIGDIFKSFPSKNNIGE
ncbi:hypothetical protein FL857_10990 [Criibacterium bergeronii]|uniref:Uncharacterized protein n=1 Tax=Criibacterium bergeronii TaxID=1871336 RepID=A0A552UWW8_9FIRM|nr:hypothetical protein [Criibacterium bergeronii]TRW22697.1 hypothetical protein FL857_10990 [Criibacterium bergeronii]